jgi:hypothetical protein
VLGTPEQKTSEPMSLTAISPTAVNTMIVVLDSYADNNTASAITTATDPATFTDNYHESNVGDDMSEHIAYAIKTGTGSTGTITVDYNAPFTGRDEDGSVVLALEEAPAAGVQAPLSRRMTY